METSRNEHLLLEEGFTTNLILIRGNINEYNDNENTARLHLTNLPESSCFTFINFFL